MVSIKRTITVLVILMLPMMTQVCDKEPKHKSGWYYDHQAEKVVIFSISPSKHGHFYNYRIWTDGKPENYSVRIRPDEKDYFTDKYDHKSKMNYSEKQKMEAVK